MGGERAPEDSRRKEKDRHSVGARKIVKRARSPGTVKVKMFNVV
jgi:hypothetical protein